MNSCSVTVRLGTGQHALLTGSVAGCRTPFVVMPSHPVDRRGLLLSAGPAGLMSRGRAQRERGNRRAGAGEGWSQHHN